jgi:hypothetical protein
LSLSENKSTKTGQTLKEILQATKDKNYKTACFLGTSGDYLYDFQIIEAVKQWLLSQRDRTDISQPQSCMYQSGWQDAFCLLLEQLDNFNSLNYKSITKGENK